MDNPGGRRTGRARGGGIIPRMRVVIACPGPSLRDSRLYTERHLEPRDEVVIAVNRAVCAVRAHWWVALDPATVSLYRDQACPALPATPGDPAPDFIPRLLYSHDAPRGWLENPENSSLLAGGLSVEQISRAWGPPPETPPPATMFSVLGAIVLGAWCIGFGRNGDRRPGERVIELHGADMRGEEDYRGFIGGNRTPERWAHETRRLDGMEEWLMRRGIRLERAPTVQEAAR